MYKNGLILLDLNIVKLKFAQIQIKGYISQNKRNQLVGISNLVYLPFTCKNVCKNMMRERHEINRGTDLQRYESLEDGRWMKRNIKYAIMAHVFTPTTGILLSM